MQLQLQDFTTLVRNMAASVQGSANSLVDLTTGSVLRAILEANASLALWLQWLIAQVLTQTRASTSTGPDLDSWVADFGVTRLPAQPASATLVLSRMTTGIAAVIPVGTQVKTSDTTQTFSVVADPTNPSFSVATSTYTLAANVSAISLPVQASVPGSAGNVQGGVITLLASAIPGVDTAFNPSSAAGGLDAETDGALRTRFANFIDSRSRATPAAIAYAVQSLQQGISYVLSENTDTSGATRPGFFTLTIDDGSGSPPSSLVTAVSNAVDLVRPVGTQFWVQAPQLIIANVSLTISTSQDGNTIAQQAVSAGITAFVASLPIGTALPISRLTAVAYASSADIVNVTAITINGSGDLIPPQFGIIRPGTISVS